MELPSLLKGVAAMLWDFSEIAVQNAVMLTIVGAMTHSGRNLGLVLCCALRMLCCALQRTPVPRSLRTPGCFENIARTCADNAQHTTLHQHHTHTVRQSASVTTNSAPQ